MRIHNKIPKIILPLLALALLAFLALQEEYAGDEMLGKYRYDDFKKPGVCKQCHVEIYQQWRQSMMSQAYTHHWDEIEYFKLAVPHAEKEPKVAGVKAGCNGCHGMGQSPAAGKNSLRTTPRNFDGRSGVKEDSSGGGRWPLSSTD